MYGLGDESSRDILRASHGEPTTHDRMAEVAVGVGMMDKQGGATEEDRPSASSAGKARRTGGLAEALEEEEEKEKGNCGRARGACAFLATAGAMSGLGWRRWRVERRWR